MVKLPGSQLVTGRERGGVREGERAVSGCMKVGLLTLFYSVSFLQSRITMNRCVF